MKTPQLRRELILVSGATLLALIPLFLLWRRSTIAPIQATSAPKVLALKPLIPRTVTGSESRRPNISPDGLWVARMEVALPAPGITPTPGNSAQPKDLVIRSASNGKEAFRATVVGEFIGWIPDSVAFITCAENVVHRFTPTPRTPRGPSPSQLWTQTTIIFPIRNTDNFDSTDYDLQTGAVVFSPDFRFAVKAYWGTGSVAWQTADLTTGKIASPVTVGRWINYDPHVGGVSNDISVAVAPASLTKGNLPVVALLQTLEKAPDYSPPPTPTPRPTPKATPTYSPVQAEFKTREERENTEIQTLVDKVLGIDGADPEVTDQDEVARITSEVQRRNKALQLERERLFPGSSALLPEPPKNQGKQTELYQVEAFDLNKRKKLWGSKLQAYIFSPQMKFARDGSSLVAWGTAVERDDNGRKEMDAFGIEFRSARTGRVTGKAKLYEGQFGIPMDSPLEVYDAELPPNSKSAPPTVFVVPDSYQATKMSEGKIQSSYSGTVFRFFNAATGRETGYLRADSPRIAADQPDFSGFSVSQSGNIWMWGNYDTFILPRRELGQESRGALPTPTPDASMVRSK